MLNISNYKVEKAIKTYHLTAFSKIINTKGAKALTYMLLSVVFLAIIVLFLPWRQNIKAKGELTTLKPEHRPQTIHSIIPGRISKWHVREGQLVSAGDTILTITEIKADYLDPELINRVQDQVTAKEQSLISYQSKIKALDKQLNALEKARGLKTAQAKNKLMQSQLKLQSNKAGYESAKTDYEIALKQFARQKTLYDQGIKSLTDFEKKKQKLQLTNAKIISAENKVSISQNDLINAQIELNAIDANYSDKIAKASSNKFSAESMLLGGTTEVLKAKNKLANYKVRSGYYHIVAPQDCYITKAITPGIGELVKEGKPIVSIMPADYNFAVELYVNPIDYPLIHSGGNVRLLFDGWPFIVFSGWPNTSFGTYGGIIVGIDQNISKNGKYRVLIKPDENDTIWPEALRVGSGAKGMALLNTVPVWYELWRQLSGFPPDYYTKNKTKNKKSDKKKK
ncbi:MAG: HlyD family secretion protein [Cyclobacteriaceae bacterium]